MFASLFSVSNWMDMNAYVQKAAAFCRCFL